MAKRITADIISDFFIQKSGGAEVISQTGKNQQIVESNPISPKLLQGMKDFTCAVTQFRVENNMINNDAESIKNDLVEGLLKNAGMVSRCIDNIAPLVIKLDHEKNIEATPEGVRLFPDEEY